MTAIQSPKPILEQGQKAAPTIPTHDRILNVAKTLFATKGYEHASTSSIARLAGTSESQLMKHFGSKAGLLEAIFIEGWKSITEQARSAIQNATSPIEKLQAIAGAALVSLERDPEMKQLLLLEARRVRREGYSALSDGFIEFVKLIDDVLVEMRDKGLLRAGLNPQAVRSALIGMLEGMLRDRMLAGQLRFPADYEFEQIRAMLGLVLRACSAA